MTRPPRLLGHQPDQLSNNEQFVQLAQQTMARFHHQAEGELAKREQAVATLVKPIGEALAKTHEQIQQLEKQREHAYGSLTQYLKTMQETQTALSAETRNPRHRAAQARRAAATASGRCSGWSSSPG